MLSGEARLKELLPIVMLIVSMTTTLLAQGLVNFANTPSTLVSALDPPRYPLPGTIPLMSGAPGSFYFGLLTSPVGANQFTFSGIYATNMSTPGLFSGGYGVAVPGWQAGTTRDFEVVGWSASLGHDWNPVWLAIGWGDVFGVSSVGNASPGDGVSTPALNLFGGVSGIQSGFSLGTYLVPEPSAVSMLAIGT